MGWLIKERLWRVVLKILEIPRNSLMYIKATGAARWGRPNRKVVTETRSELEAVDETG